MPHVLIALAAVLAFVFNFLALQDRTETVLVAVADRPIDAGSRVDASDIRFVEIPADFAGLDGLVDEARWDQVSGWVAVRPIPAGVVVASDGLSEPAGGDGLRTMSVPIPLEHAAGGLLEVGDTVDVISVADTASFVVTGVEVVGLAPDPGSGIGSSGGYYVVLAVDAEQALGLAAAIDRGSIEVVRSTGASSIPAGQGVAP